MYYFIKLKWAASTFFITTVLEEQVQVLRAAVLYGDRNHSKLSRDPAVAQKMNKRHWQWVGLG